MLIKLAVDVNLKRAASTKEDSLELQNYQI